MRAAGSGGDVLHLERLLLLPGFEINGIYRSEEDDIQGKRALHFAAIVGNIHAVRWLLDHGAEVDAQDEDFDGGSTSLWYVAFRGHVGVARVLLDAGADVNNSGFLGALLQHAVLYNAMEVTDAHTATLDLLLDRGGNVHENAPQCGGTVVSCPLWWMDVS